jgi:hypothetical protein
LSKTGAPLEQAPVLLPNIPKTHVAGTNALAYLVSTSVKTGQKKFLSSDVGVVEPEVLGHVAAKTSPTQLDKK